jgi:multicomponent Na+:H+ antiporter subunit F
MMLAALAGALLATMAMALARALMGPTLYDRILALNMFGTNTVLIVAVLGYLHGRPDFLDIALLYALVNFVGVLALLRFFQLSRYGRRRTPRVSS